MRPSLLLTAALVTLAGCGAEQADRPLDDGDPLATNVGEEAAPAAAGPVASATRLEEPPVASAIGRRCSGSLNTSESSREFAGPTLAKATRSPDRKV